MIRLGQPNNWLAHFSLCLVLLAGALVADVPSQAQERHPILIGPRSIYPLAGRLRSRSDIPLVIRDAIEHVANGTRLLAIGPRIMGGEPAPIGAFPWMASLELKVRRKDAHFCGGAFIAREWVITAAHCVNPSSAGAIDVLGGTNTLDTGGMLYPVDRVIVHEKYSTETQDYDVALLHLAKPYTGATIRLLSAADGKRLLEPGRLAISAGWGYTAEGGDVSNVLRNVTVQIVSNETCNGLAAYAGAVTPRMVCAGFPQGGKDSCQGDSGGPLMVADGQGGYFQAGITSWGEGCGRPNKFGVYTRVATIADWVAEKIGTKAAPTAPVASNAANASSKTGKPDTGKTETAKTEPAKPESVQTKSANAKPASAGIMRLGPPAPARFGDTPQSSGAPALRQVSPDEAAPVLSVPMPQPRPSLRKTRQPSSRLRTERRMGVPIDRKYSPAYPARAQSPRSYQVLRPRRRTPPRGRLRNDDTAPRQKPRGYYMPPDRGHIDLPPSFDWRVR